MACPSRPTPWGKGSRRYGKTSDHVLALDLMLADGTGWRAEIAAA